jgi:hypothetical protein
LLSAHQVFRRCRRKNQGDQVAHPPKFEHLEEDARALHEIGLDDLAKEVEKIAEEIAILS